MSRPVDSTRSIAFKAICGFRLVTAEPDRLAEFYSALGFRRWESVPIASEEMALLELRGRGTRLALTLGPSRLELDWFDRSGAPYPVGADAADTVFQHLALATSDAATAWRRAEAAGATPISRAGPVKLPASSGGVTAGKFRDPEGHPLELLEFPAMSDSAWEGAGTLGVDHSAICVVDIDRSRAFYEAHGLRPGKRTLNEGPTQVSLDGLDAVEVDVVPIIPERARPHLELLGYRNPLAAIRHPPSTNDIAATRIIWEADRDALVRDPDGHLHQLVARRP